MIELREDMKEAYDTIDFTTNTNFQTNFNTFQMLSKEIVDKHAPLTTRSISYQNNTPWVDTEYKRCRARRRKLEKIWKMNKTGKNM